MRIKHWCLAIGQFCADLIFPKKCLGCNRPNKWLCEACYWKIKALPQARLPQVSPNKLVNKLIAPLPYDDRLVRKLITAYKYHFVHDLRADLGRLLAERLKPILRDSASKDYVIIPVPLHPKRLRFRGFNQAELLGETLAEKLNLALRTDILSRSRYTKPQVNLKETMRKKNIHAAFRAEACPGLKDKTVLLLDDVMTSGATLEECAKAIRASCKPKAIWGVAVAKG